jgi:protein-S-isoprenylcysteine O-methyltransferase Ste14
MARASSALVIRAFLGLAFLTVVMGAVLFGGAGTLSWLDGWTFLATFFGASLAVTLYLIARDPALLERRVRAGPLAENSRTQKVLQSIASLAFLSTLAVPALDRRFSWSSLPRVMTLVGEVLIVVGFAVVFFVFRANTFTAATIEVAAKQKVIATGPYGVVRHPMYAGALVLLVGVPLALGSVWGLLTLVPMATAIVWRLLDEERFLARDLEGYAEYQTKVRHRLLPLVW